MSSEETTFTCQSCDYTACNRQELYQHLTIVHKQKQYKCHLCPFMSPYKNNFNRHKRSVHKYISCEVCGVPCDSEQDLLLHTREVHADLLSYQDETQKRPRTAGQQRPTSPSVEKTFNLTEQANALYLSQFNLINSQPEPEVEDAHQEPIGSPPMDLMPQKFKRQYQCTECEYRTFSPREFLYHRRDMHHDTNSIFECPMCIYATKHNQKLARHTLLVHKFALPGNIKSPRKRKPKPKTVSKPAAPAPPTQAWRPQPVIDIINVDEDSSYLVERSPVKSPKTKFPCTKCDFQSKSKFLLAQHEKTVHLRKKFFRCLKCAFVTNERGRYNKHVKYHNQPKLVCSECQFCTPYRWNLDRHMKNHQLTKGKFGCKKCTFMTNSSQSFKTHILHHHKKFDCPEDMIPEDDEETEVTTNGHGDDDDEEDTEISNNELEEEDEDMEHTLHWKTDDEEEDNVPLAASKTKDRTKLRIFKSPSPLPESRPVEDATPKYPCPLCGVVFNQLSWLARHLSQKHEQSPNVKKLAKAVQKLTPQNPPDQVPEPGAVRPKFNVAIKSFPKPPSKKPAEELESGVSAAPSVSRTIKKRKAPVGPPKPSGFPTHVCQVCLYKNTLMSEMEKHVLTHCTDRPFACHLCKFRCRWKGDMKKHVLRNHGSAAVAVFERAENPLLKYIKTVPTQPDSSDEIKEDVEEYEEPSSEKPFKKPKTKAELAARLKDEPRLLLTTKSRTITPPARNKSEGYWQGGRPNAPTPPVAKKPAQQECPLDLTTVKEEKKPKGNLDSLLRMEPMKLPRIQMKSPVTVSGKQEEPTPKVESQGIKRPAESDDSYMSDEDSLFHRYLEAQQNYFYGETEDFPMESPHKKRPKMIDETTNRNIQANKKYKCSYCPFMSHTASRFHVHIVQHLNKKPFMCSVCSYRSNWEWDITKHIKIKSSRDPQHASAQMMVTDETGLKNYEKYNKFLVADYSGAGASSPGTSPPQEDNLEQVISPEDLVETVLVTPELEDAEREGGGNDAETSQSVSGQVFRCGHCLFKHPDKKIVISHLGVHFRSKPYRCRLCGIASSWKHVMLRHVKAQHGGEPKDVEDRLQYQTRGNTLYVSGSAVDQNEQPISTAVFECHLCPYTSDYNHHMQLHLRQHCPREGANMKCPHCPYWVKYKKTLNSHLRFHPQAKDSAIPGSSPSMSSSADDHGDVGIDYEAQNDEEAMMMEDATVAGMASPVRKYHCESCSFRTDNKSHFLYHKQFHRPNKNAPFKCTHCSYWSCFKNIMNKHVRTHTEAPNDVEVVEVNPPYEMVEVNGKTIKMFKCRFCPMMNKRRSNVKTHESQHSNTKNMRFSCTTCSYQSNNQGVITSHMRLHGDSNITIAEFLNESLKYPPDPVSTTEPESPPRTYEELPPAPPTPTPRAKQSYTYVCKRCPAAFKSKCDYDNHSSFHGAKLPHTCTHCDYRARHKPHLHRHMTVHTPEYIAKRDKAIKDMAQKDSSALAALLTTPSSQPKVSSEPEPVEISIDDPEALAKEKKNTLVFSKNQGTGKNAKRKFRCKACPMAFNSLPELLFHKRLHKSGAQHSCPKCSFAVNKSELLAVHVKIHTKSIPAASLPSQPATTPAPASTDVTPTTTSKTVLKIVSCPMCPAVFTKADRLWKHVSLHGANNRYTCTECDYSVRFIANLGKHRKVHTRDYKPAALQDKKERKQSPVPEATVAPPAEPTPAASPVKKVATKSQPKDPKEKHIFQCSRCPYGSNRKDAVQNHMNRHGNTTSTVACPYCDYATSAPSFLKDHMKLHFQPRSFIKVRAYMKYDQLEIWSCNGSKALIFKDHGEDKVTRFFPEVIEEESEDEEESEASSSDVATSRRSSVDERNLIENAIQEGKKLEIVLTRADSLSSKTLSTLIGAVKRDPVVKTKSEPPEETGEDQAGTTELEEIPDISVKKEEEEERSEIEMPKEPEQEEEIAEDATENGSLILSSLGNDSACEDAMPRRTDTPTELLGDLMDELEENEELDFVKEHEVDPVPDLEETEQVADDFQEEMVVVEEIVLEEEVVLPEEEEETDGPEDAGVVDEIAAPSDAADVSLEDAELEEMEVIDEVVDDMQVEDCSQAAVDVSEVGGTEDVAVQEEQPVGDFVAQEVAPLC